ncbi:DUF4421 family protein [Flavobacterium alkalisoli]|uniref:DUF4421 family protein n=1 Tax=Flavobacterium alkalisoli TaxID=2602769 RepID=UPI003A8E9D06
MDVRGYIGGLFFICGGCFAQQDSISNPYIQYFDDKISVQLYMHQTSNDFTLKYTEDNTVVDVEPNKKTTLGVAVQYDFISFSIGVAPRFFANNKDRKDSKMTSFGFNFFPGQWVQHFDFYYQKGISLKADGFEDVYLPGLKTLKIGGSTGYVFNENFSFKAVAFQNVKQLKSAGSFAPFVSYYYTELNGKKEPQLGGKAYFIDVALSPSYNYNLVVAKNFLIAAGASFGAGFSYINDEGENNTAFLTQVTLSLSMGYNSDTFYGGLYSKGRVSNHNTSLGVNMNDTIGYGTLFFGYRFGAPKVVKEETQKIKDIIKI